MIEVVVVVSIRVMRKTPKRKEGYSVNLLVGGGMQ